MRSLVSLALLLGLSAPAFADPGDDVLAKVDRALGNFADQKIAFSVQNLKPGTAKPSTMAFTSLVKEGKTFTSFEAPGDIKGTRVLTRSSTEAWIYLPEFGKIRKVSSHNLNQGFMGTTLTQQDMGTTAYTPDYDAALVSEDDSVYVLELVARDAKQVAYAKLKMTVDKKMNVPLSIEYFSDAGEIVRTQTRSGYTCPKADYCMFKVMKMEDHTTGAWTTLTAESAETDTGLSDEIFTPRTLQIGL